VLIANAYFNSPNEQSTTATLYLSTKSPIELRIVQAPNGNTNPSGVYVISSGSAFTVKAIADEGYLFKHWLYYIDNGDITEINSANSILAISANGNVIYLNPVFEK
jgi:hypothetical protein